MSLRPPGTPNSSTLAATPVSAFTTSRACLSPGSSLSVMSGYRVVRHAARLGIPVAIVNQGPTRGDPEATFTVDAPLGRTLSALLPA